MSRANSDHSPLRSPPMPAPRPATLMSWQGNPPQMRSTPSPFAERCCADNSRTSWNMWTSGQCLASTRRAKGSISQNATVRMPARSRPRLKAPMPLNRSRTRTGLLVLIRSRQLAQSSVSGNSIDLYASAAVCTDRRIGGRSLALVAVRPPRRAVRLIHPERPRGTSRGTS